MITSYYFLHSIVTLSSYSHIAPVTASTVVLSKLRAKTGTMKGISTLSGYLETRDSEMIIFLIMILNHNLHLTDIQNLQDIIVMRLTAFTRHPELFPNVK